MAKLLYQGHGSYRITSDEGTGDLCRPVRWEGYDVPADVILVTHQHHDHSKPGARPAYRGVLAHHQQGGAAGGEYQRFEVKDVRIKAVPAYNRNHDRKECVGYVLTLGDALRFRRHLDDEGDEDPAAGDETGLRPVAHRRRLQHGRGRSDCPRRDNRRENQHTHPYEARQTLLRAQDRGEVRPAPDA